jgi:diguanylate cyclase (GGDEF)-like protein/PAS domain S-box-containing protein
MRFDREAPSFELRKPPLSLLGRALDAAAPGVLITNRDGTIEWANPALIAMTGYSLDELVGSNPRLLQAGGRKPVFFRDLWKTILAGTVWQGEIENRKKDGASYIAEMTIAPIREEDGSISHFVAVEQDVTARKRQQEEISRLGSVDPLTRLLNRASFSVHLEVAVARAKGGPRGALLQIDLDRFRVVNDLEGHSAGDQLLVMVAERLAAALRPIDAVARLGGGEFAVILPDVDREKALETAEVLRSAIGDFGFQIGGRTYNLTASVGFATIDGSARSESVRARADEALQAAKELGRDQTFVWEEDLTGHAPMTEHRRWAIQLQNALRDDRVVIHFQPVVSLTSGCTVYHEALVRITSPDGALVPPGDFLPAAERFGLMPQVDRRVVEKSLELLARRPDVNLFVNLAGGSLTDESLLDWLCTAIAARALAPGRLTFEITETTALSDLARVQRAIRQLKQLGCCFAIDDFGTGFASFGYLRSLPVDEVKIDGSYVHDIDRNPTSRALVSAMAAVAHALGKSVVAEMVDRESVATILRELGVEYGQGWHWGAASPEPMAGAN